MQDVDRNGDMSAPVVWDEARALPKRNAPKGLLPSTWLTRGLTVEYVDACGDRATLKGVLLEMFPFGMIVNAMGTKTALSWDRVVLVELEDG